MSIFVSQSRFKQTGFEAPVGAQFAYRKTVLTAALLTLSLAAHAESLEAAADHVRSGAQSSQQQMPDVRKHRGQSFPHWPQHQQANKEIIPPPPPGPYVSSALSDYSVAMPSPAYHTAKPVQRYPSNNNDSTSAPMATFSPDIPWPTNLQPQQPMPNHRVSGQGSHPVPPSYGPGYGSEVNNNYGNYNYGNRSNPYVNDMGMKATRWMPNMERPVPGPYNNRLNYAPNYRSYYEPGYGQPVINNNGTRSASPAYR